MSTGGYRLRKSLGILSAGGWSSVPTLTKICLVKAMVFPLVIYGCESWTVKKAEH